MGIRQLDARTVGLSRHRAAHGRFSNGRHSHAVSIAQEGGGVVVRVVEAPRNDEQALVPGRCRITCLYHIKKSRARHCDGERDQATSTCLSLPLRPISTISKASLPIIPSVPTYQFVFLVIGAFVSVTHLTLVHGYISSETTDDSSKDGCTTKVLLG